jgi:hypothetical protein
VVPAELEFLAPALLYNTSHYVSTFFPSFTASSQLKLEPGLFDPSLYTRRNDRHSAKCYYLEVSLYQGAESWLIIRRAAPTGRGTFNLIVSCIVTLSLCVYTALHLNVPGELDGKGRRFFRKVKWAVIGIFAPEIVLFVASRQWYTARELTTKFEKAMEDLRSNHINARCKANYISAGFFNKELDYDPFSSPLWVASPSTLILDLPTKASSSTGTGRHA